jgi:TonB-dependent receptor
MKKIISQSLMVLFLLIQCSFVFSQTKTITGKITDENGETLPGVNIVEQGTTNGTITNAEGLYTIQLKKDDAVLMFSFIGYKSIEIPVAGKSVIDVKLEMDAEVLQDVVVVGIRASQLRSSKVKRLASTVIEAITPEDIGSFSDENVADALMRVPGVQIERNVDGVSGDRVSLRGMGPQFVKVTINGRTPISAGNEGRSDMRKFNMNVIPTEIINGAKIYKGAEAKMVASGLGGTVDFQTLRPLDLRYENGKNYFGSVNMRGSSNSKIDDLDFSPRISGAFGGKIADKLGAVATVVYSDEKNSREESAMRGYRTLDFREDTNNDGTFNVDDGDILYEGMLAPAVINNTLIGERREHLGVSAALQWKPSEKFEMVADYTLTRYYNNSDRQFFQMSLAPGGNNGLYGKTNNNFFSPGSILFNGSNLQYIDAAGANKSRVTIQNRNLFYDNHTTNSIAGLNTKYKPTEKLTVNLDFSYSNLDFFQDLKNTGSSRLNWNAFDQSEYSLDLRGRYPQYGLPQEIHDPSLFGVLSTGLRQIKTVGENYAAKIDLEYELNKKTSISLGSRYAVTDFETREAGGKITYTTEQKAEFIALRSGEDNLTDGNFHDGNTGLTQWIHTPGREVLALTPEQAALDGGSAFDFDTPLSEVTSDEDNLTLSSAKSYGSKETTFSTYLQLNTETEVFNIPLSLNVGVRAVNTKNVSRGFTGVEHRDPISGTNTIVTNALYHETESSDWDLLPSLNANFKLKSNINYRIGVAKAVSRPRYRDIIPSNDIDMLDPASAIFDSGSPDYIDDLGSSTYRGKIVSGNPELKPYSAWMIDNTFELYSKNGGAFIASVFYKNIKNFIGSQVLNDVAYPGYDALGVNLPAGQEDLLFDITNPMNVTDAQVYGFEVGFNQHFTFLPGFLNGFGLQANYTFVESKFDEAVGDAVNGFPGSSRDNINSVLYYEKYGFAIRFTTAYRGNYLSNLGGVGSTRADEGHYTEGTTVLGFNVKYNVYKGLSLSAGCSNITGEDTRRYIADDPRNLNSYYGRNPIWKIGLRYKL